jgi:hypothetical protein
MSRARVAEAAGFGALLAVISYLLHGYSYGNNAHHAQFLPYFFKLLDPGLYPNDAYLDTIGRLPTLFWKGLALACAKSGAEPETVFAVLFAVTSWATWGVVFLLAREFSASRRGALAGCALALCNAYLHRISPLSQDDFFRNHLDATSFGLPLALLSLWAFLRDRPALAGGALGLVLWIQPLHSANFALAIGAAELAGTGGIGSSAGAGRTDFPTAGSRRARPWEAFLRFAGAWALFAWPAFLLGLRPPAAAIGSAEWARLLRLWYPGHYFLPWCANQWIHVLCQGALLAGLGLLLARRGQGVKALRFVAAFLLLGLACAALGSWCPWRPLVCLQMLRLDGPALLLLILSAGALLDRVPLRTDSQACLAVVGSALGDPLPFLFPQACAAAHVAALCAGPRWIPWAAAGTLAASAAILCGLAPLAHHGASTWPIALLSALTLWNRREDGSAGGIGSSAGMKALLAVVLIAGLAFSIRDLRKDDRTRLASQLGGEPLQLQETAMWVRRNTAQDARILCFPGSKLQRLVFRRSLVGEWLDGSALNWDPDYGPVWISRMEELGYRLENIPRAHAKEAAENFPVFAGRPPSVPVLVPWDGERVRRLIREYRPAKVITPFPLALPELRPEFRSGRYIVYGTAP